MQYARLVVGELASAGSEHVHGVRNADAGRSTGVAALSCDIDAAVEGRALPLVRTSPSTPRAEARSRFQAKGTDKGVGTVAACIDKARHATGRSLVAWLQRTGGAPAEGDAVGGV